MHLLPTFITSSLKDGVHYLQSLIWQMLLSEVHSNSASILVLSASSQHHAESIIHNVM